MEMELGGGDVPPLPDACAPVNARFKGSTEGGYGPKLGLKSKGKKRQKPIAMMGENTVDTFRSASRRVEMIRTYASITALRIPTFSVESKSDIVSVSH